MKHHPYVVPIDPAGADGRRWRCKACGKTGSLSSIVRTECPTPTKPFEYDAEIDAVLSGKA